MTRKHIKSTDKLPLSLTANERKVVLSETVMDHDLGKQIRIAEVHGKKFVSKFTLSDLDELHGYISFVYNHTKSSKIEKIVGRVLSKIESLLDAYTDQNEPEHDNLFGLSELPEPEITIRGEDYFRNPKNDFERSISESMKGKVFSSMEDLNDFLSEKNDEYNNTPQPDMGGLSPEQVSSLINFKWDDERCALRLNNNLSYEDVRESPIIFNAIHFLSILEQEGGSKATAKGNLNRKFIKQMIEQLKWPREYVEIFFPFSKVANEEDIFPLYILRLLLQEGRLIRKFKGYFKITKNGKNFLSENHSGDLYLLLFKTLFTRVNLAYLDRMPEWSSFQWTIPFTFNMFGKLGSKWAKPEDLAPTLLLPKVKEEILQSFAQEELRWVLEKRFINPFESFGLIEKLHLPKEGLWREPYEIRKTALYDKFIGFEFRKLSLSLFHI